MSEKSGNDKKKATKKPLTFLQQLEHGLLALGITKRRSQEVAKGLVPKIRRALKEEEKAKILKASQPKEVSVRDAYNEEKRENGLTVRENKDGSVLINRLKFRLDLPVVRMQGDKGLDILRVMDGLYTTATYLVAAVRGENGIVAIRKLGEDYFNIKFYPNLQHWELSQEDLKGLGAEHGSYLSRAHYERMHFNKAGMENVMARLTASAKPKTKIQALMDRFLAVASKPLIKAFEILETRRGSLRRDAA